MSVDSEFGASGDSSGQVRRIRSGHRRRLLDRLTDGAATVSVLARDAGLRIPHASAELRRMRNDGLVASDLAAGARGARLHLTQAGWETIRSDELARALEALPLPQPSAQCSLLARDGANLLLGVLAPMDSPLVLIPDRPVAPTSSEGTSTGSEGVSWIWATLRERSPRWFDLSTLEMLPEPPTGHDPQSISAYVGDNNTLGIVRARLIDVDRPVALAPGIWFEPPAHRPQPPLPEASHHRGGWVLGNCHDQSPEVRPKDPLVAIMDERLPRSMLLRTARANALVIADLGGLDASGDDYPISSLENWIARAHPRLRPSERKRRLNSLRERLTSTRRVRVEEATWRRFRKDWGESDFTLEESSLRLLDTRGLGTAASTALVEWAVGTDEGPALVLEIQDSLPDDVITAVISHPRLRLALTSSPMPAFGIFDELEVDPLRPLPWLRLRTRGGRVLPLRLVDSVPRAEAVETEADESLSPWLLLSGEVGSGLAAAGDTSMVASASAQFPEGNEDWANMMEASYPLAAWIASPRRTRWHRWQRLRSRLDSEWLALMDLEHLPLERLAEVADEAPDRVLEMFALQLRAMLRNDSEIALRTRPAIDPAQSTRGASWVAAQLLANAAWLPPFMHSDLLGWALEAWLVHPPAKSRPALEAVDWIHSEGRGTGSDYGPILQGVLRRAKHTPDGQDLKTWSLLVERILDGKSLEIEGVEAIVETLPLDWWAPLAPELLINLLTPEDGIEWLTENPLPWAAAVLRPQGEVSSAPGLRTARHPGCTPELRAALARRLRVRSERGTLPKGAEALLDLLNALDSIHLGEAPSTGRTHPLIGWLAQPIERWPAMTNEMVMVGDPHVAERLIQRRSGYHEELAQTQQIT